MTKIEWISLLAALVTLIVFFSGRRSIGEFVREGEWLPLVVLAPAPATPPAPTAESRQALTPATTPPIRRSQSLDSNEEALSPAKRATATASLTTRLDLERFEHEVFARIDELRGESTWAADPRLIDNLRDCSVNVYFTESRLDDAARIAYRFSQLGAKVKVEAVSPRDASGKEMRLAYHWNRFQSARAAQNITNDIEPLRLVRDDDLPYIAVWVVRGAK